MFKRLFNRTPRPRRADIENYVRNEYKPADFEAMVTELTRKWDAR